MRSPYGAGGTPTDLGRVMYRTPRRAYALRSASTPDGYVSAYGRKPRTARKEKVSTTTNLVEHVDAPIRRYQRTDHDAERKLVPTVVMADF